MSTSHVHLTNLANAEAKMKSLQDVLVVDDSAMARKQLAAIICDLPGFRVVGEASNGAEAVRLYHNLSPDIVCMDIMMPVMDGLTATRSIVERDPKANIVIASSLAGLHDKVSEALRVGAKNVIEKPYDAEKIETALKALSTKGPQ